MSPRASLVVLLLLAAGCSGQEELRRADGGALPPVAACSSEPVRLSCHRLENPISNRCSDFGQPPTCIGGEWACAEGFLPRDRCSCVDLAPGPGCVCTPAGWSCSTAGGRDAAQEAGSSTAPVWDDGGVADGG